MAPDETYLASDFPEDIRPRRRWRLTALLALLIFVGGAALAAWVLTNWAPARALIAPPQPARPVAVSAPMPLTAPTPAPVPSGLTESRVTDLEARMAQLDQHAAAAAGNAGRAEGLLIAFAARRAVDRGVGLGDLEGALREHFAASQPLAVGAVIAASQTPMTLDALRSELDTVAPALAGGGKDEGWWAATQRTIGSLFIVRRKTKETTAPDDAIKRARLRINSGQVEGALAEVSRMPGSDAASGWATDARRYIEAHRALDILEAAALTQPDRAVPAQN